MKPIHLIHAAVTLSLFLVILVIGALLGVGVLQFRSAEKDGRPGGIDKSPTELLIVVKFRGQKEGSAGIAFPNTSRLMPVDFMLSQGTYFKNLKEFREKMKTVPGLKLYILDEKAFKSESYDSTIFQGFEDRFIDAK